MTDGTAGGEDPGGAPQMLYPGLDAFVEGFLAQIWDRPLGSGTLWCAQWWAHAEAVFYLTALWHAWEDLRADGGASGMAAWCVNYLYPIMDRLTAEDGPFKGCQPEDGFGSGAHRPESAPHPGRRLPTVPAPPGLFEERP